MRGNNKPDDRRDNVERIQKNINHTIQNMELADEMMEKTSNEKTKQELSAKNDRREKTLEGLRHEIQDEAIFQEKRKAKKEFQAKTKN